MSSLPSATPSPFPPPSPAINYDDDSAYFNSFPCGVRFCPHDDELIDHYLQKKVMKQELPKNRIPEIELYKYDPDHLAVKEDSTSPQTSRAPDDMKLDEWVLCKIYKHSRKSMEEAHNNGRQSQGEHVDMQIGGDGDRVDGNGQDFAPLNVRDNSSLPEDAYNNSDKRDGCTDLINPPDVDETDHSLHLYDLGPLLPDNFSYFPNISFGDGDPNSLVEPVSFMTPMPFTESFEPENCDVFNTNDVDSFDFDVGDYLLDTSEIPPSSSDDKPDITDGTS
ncbi:hypothetical protein NE237_026994 [Protea cynaroides]|uniref:NAC domain-containing protein n=1 Tax=Protea cynaroides TaxID=273540 RepID=A0A9Q0JSS1_9MAGN|nr:hypothetical protein NE237_026994 [Protea cynaroides]